MTSEEWSKKIRVESKGKGKGRYYSASCPICAVSYDVDVLNSDAVARVAAIQRITAHITTAHQDRVADAADTKTA